MLCVWLVHCSRTATTDTLQGFQQDSRKSRSQAFTRTAAVVGPLLNFFRQASGDQDCVELLKWIAEREKQLYACICQYKKKQKVKPSIWVRQPEKKMSDDEAFALMLIAAESCVRGMSDQAAEE